jgi:hypothetical protein
MKLKHKQPCNSEVRDVLGVSAIGLIALGNNEFEFVAFGEDGEVWERDLDNPTTPRAAPITATGLRNAQAICRIWSRVPEQCHWGLKTWELGA